MKAANHSHAIFSVGFFIDKMSDYGTGFLMSGVAFIVSAMFLFLLLHQMNRRGQPLRDCMHDNDNAHKTGQSVKAEATEMDMYKEI